MTIFEIICMLGGFILGSICLVFSFYYDYNIKLRAIIFQILTVLFFIVGFGTFAKYDIETSKTETNNIVITIQDKEKRRYYCGKVYLYDYYIYFDNDKKIEVDRAIFENYNINDTIVINKTIKYRLNRTTNTWEIEKIIYN